ncbi:hypothetical protein SDJN03_28750, partial [Cucurbita argyrosperma subsp. sororia]
MDLKLSLALPSAATAATSTATSAAAAYELHLLSSLRTPNNLGVRQTSLRRRKSNSPTTGPIEPPYPWSTDRIAVVQTLQYLTSNQILTITGEVKCQQCRRIYEMEYDVVSKFNEIGRFVEHKMESFRDRAPKEWMQPNYPTCRFCGAEKGVKPVIPKEWEKINWVFLLLGEMIGALKLNHLKYFCSYTKNHRTGSKDRLVYLTYITLCRQIDPSGRFSPI